MLIKLSPLIVLTLVGYCFSGDTEITTDIFKATKIECSTINNINQHYPKKVASEETSIQYHLQW